MRSLPIAAIEVDPDGRLFVYPAETTAFYEYIYREANGLRWDRERLAFHAHEPSRWKHEELMKHLATTVRDALDQQLCVTEASAWIGVAPELQHRLQQVLSAGATQP